MPSKKQAKKQFLSENKKAWIIEELAHLLPEVLCHVNEQRVLKFPR